MILVRNTTDPLATDAIKPWSERPLATDYDSFLTELQAELIEEPVGQMAHVLDLEVIEVTVTRRSTVSRRVVQQVETTVNEGSGA